ncbi:MAG: FtsX-like permease family protein [Acidobacteriota bacterium]|nr:FtsX-like permease family protein [Acidobacteriota bacterium]
MTPGALVRRSLRHHARTNAAVVAGVACAVAVLAGALIVGESVRGSLRALVDQRLGRADSVITSETFFREALASEVHAASSGLIEAAAPAVAVNAIVTHEASGRRASKVIVYGIDDRFFALHGVNRVAPSGREVLLSAGLASELGAAPGEPLVVRVERPSDIPLESLHGRREEGGRTLRTTAAGVLPAEELGDFAPSPSQGPVRAIFMNLGRLQADLAVDGRVNLALLRRKPNTLESLRPALEAAARPADLGLKSSVLDERTGVIESQAGLLTAEAAAAIEQIARDAGIPTLPVMTYLANEFQVGDRVVPYSLVTALDPARLTDDVLRAGLASTITGSLPPIVLNDWAARDLGAKPGDRLRMSYYRWLDEGRLGTESAEFMVSAVVPIAGLAADRKLSPEYPGISDSDDLSDWNPPFPVDLSRVRPIDEDYWDAYRTTPKAFIPLDAGQRIWGSRYGALTSIRALPVAPAKPGDFLQALDAGIMRRVDLESSGLQLIDVRKQGQDAAQGSADFAQYFLGFSSFLLMSALLLASLFFRLGIEQRLREIGLLQALGFPRRTIRRLFLAEGLALALAGSLAGAALGVAYAAFVLYGLRTWWSGAVNITALSLHVSPAPLVIGVLAGVVTAAICIVLSLRGLRGLSPRSVLGGGASNDATAARKASKKVAVLAVVCALAAIALVGAGFARLLPDAAAFFPAGMLLLTSVLACLRLALRGGNRPALAGGGTAAIARLGARNAAWRPGRSVLSAALVASAVFMIVSVDAFRKGPDDALEPDGGAGGFAIIGESSLPMVHDLNSAEGRDAAGLTPAADALDGSRFYPLRLRAGDDASCLNLYKPRRPRIVGVTRAFVDARRFHFSASTAETEEDRANPWRLLAQPQADGAIPAIADATSLQYVLHAAVGDELTIDEDSARPIRLRIVGAIAHSVLQGEIMIGEAAFLKLFPGSEGFRMLLADIPHSGEAEALGPRIRAVTAALEEGLSDAGLDAGSTNDRLAVYNRVENTYLSTFQTLGALGLLLGTVGLATVLARNVLERRRELALLRAVGYAHGDVSRLVLSEHLMLLAAGIAAGVIAAAVAILPALLDRGMPGGWTLPAWLAGIFAAGAIATVLAGRFALGRPLVSELRSE